MLTIFPSASSCVRAKRARRRQVFFTNDGWPVVAPERYTATPGRKFKSADLAGTWEIIRLHEPDNERPSRGGTKLFDNGWNVSTTCVFDEKGTISGNPASTWTLNEQEQQLNLTLDGEIIDNLIIFAGHDWERELDTVLFTGLDKDGRAVWGKRVI